VGQQFVGIDLHRRRSVIVRTGAGGEVLETVQVVNDAERLGQVLARAGESPQPVLEATYGWYWAVDALQAAGARVHLAHPLGVKAFEYRRVKNDTASYGFAFVYLRRFVAPRGLPAVPVATVQVTLGAVVMLLLAPFIAAQPVRLSWQVLTAMLALGMVGTGLAYVSNTNIVACSGATNASTVTYLTPLVGVVAGAAALGEQPATCGSCEAGW
jgi:EamA-like transporter family